MLEMFFGPRPKQSKKTPNRKGHNGPSFRPELQVLEDRLAPSVSVTNPGSQTQYDGGAVALQVAAVDSLANSMTFNAVNLAPGLTITSDTGLISGTINSTADLSSPY